MRVVDTHLFTDTTGYFTLSSIYYVKPSMLRRMRPIARVNMVMGHGNGQPFIGLGRCVTIRNVS